MFDNKEYLASDDFSEFESVNHQHIDVQRLYIKPTITTIPFYRCLDDDIEQNNNNDNNIAFINSSNKLTMTNNQDIQSDDEPFAEFGPCFDDNHCYFCHDTKFSKNTDQYMFNQKNIDIDRIIHGYIVIHSHYFIHRQPVPSNIISDIITLCKLFCCILDKFDIKTASTQSIDGLNNNIAIIKTSGFVFNHNTIPLKGKYRWSFKITDCYGLLTTSITFSFQQNGKCIACHSIYPQCSDEPHPTKDILHIDFDADHQCITFQNDANHKFFNTEIVNRLNDDECRLCIFVRSGSATIEMVRYQYDQNYNHYINIISQSDHDRKQRMIQWMTENMQTMKLKHLKDNVTWSEGIDEWIVIESNKCESNERISKKSFSQRILDGLSSRYNHLSTFGHFGRHC